jgi:hypothetical protein
MSSERAAGNSGARIWRIFVAVTLADDVVEHLGRERRHLGEAVDSSTGLTMLNDE